MRYSLTHVGDSDLVRQLTSLVARDNATTAELLAHIAEVDARRLYVPAGCDSMHAYCVRVLHLAEGSARKRIWAARAARGFPAIFAAIAEGRLHLSGACLLVPFLTHENADELIEAAAHQTKAGIEQMLAMRFPRTEALPLVEPIPVFRMTQRSPGNVVMTRAEHSPAQAIAPPPSRIEPIAHDRVALHLSISRSAHEDLEYARALLGHQIPDGDLGAVAEMAFRLLVEDLERQKFAATRHPAKAPRRTESRRHIPARVKRAVWQRDGGTCSFVSEGGRRCGSNRRLEFDHVQPVARGGESTAGNRRLRCRAHNQYAAEQAFGATFMHEKHAASAARRAMKLKRMAAGPAAQQAIASGRDVTPWLKQLGIRAGQARHLAALCDEALPDASLEARVKFALQRQCSSPSFAWFRAP